jgi:NAD(P)-dependent dehydrogenase (short-subunit alcohol dehydrogenase family)
MGRFDGRVALVTGGGSGIGEATCRRLAAEGAQVVVVDVDEGAARRVAAAVGGRPFRADVADAAQSEAMIRHAVDVHGRLDVLDNNATGGGTLARVADLDLDAWQRALAVNLRSTWSTAAHTPATRSASSDRNDLHLGEPAHAHVVSPASTASAPHTMAQTASRPAIRPTSTS